MIVLKFGGTSVGDGERIGRVADLVASRRGEGPLAVVSAVGGVTDLLVSLSRSSKAKDRAAADAAVEEISARHRRALAALALPADEEQA